MSLNGAELSTYDKTDAKWENLLSLLIEEFTNFLPSETAVSMRTYIPKIEECYPFLIIYGVMFRERDIKSSIKT